MALARLVITAVTAQGLSQSEAAAKYGVSKGWVSKLMARWRAEGDAAFEPRSRRPLSSPNRVPDQVVALVVALRGELAGRGLDAGPETICWHLEHHHGTTVSRASVARILARHQLVVPEPRKRPKSSYTRFEASQPNETWQSDFTHYPLTRPNGRPGIDTEILCWLDDCSRYALRVTVHRHVTTPIVLAEFRAATTAYGVPVSTLTDNGLVFTARYARGGHSGPNGFEAELRRLHVRQKNGQPSHPQTQGKVERFQQTLKKWLAAQPVQPTTIADLQQLVDTFADEYNHRRPHRSLPHRATPAARYQQIPKAFPAGQPPEPASRIRTDKIDKSGRVTLRHAGRLHHIGIGRTHTGTLVTMLIQDLAITIINTATGEVLRELVLDPTRDYQPAPTTRNR